MTLLLTDKEKERFRAHQLLTQGKSENFVAKKLGRDVQWIKRTEKRFKELGSFQDRPRPGQPTKMTEGDKKRLVKQVQGKKRKSTRKVSATFQTKKHEKLGRETIRITLKASGLFPHRMRKTPKLTDKQKLKRVAFAKKYRRYDWSKCAFWDETEFELTPTPNPKNDIIWDKKGKEHRYGKLAHPAKFKFGAAITVHGATRIVPYTGTIDAPKFITMVDKVIPDLNKMFGKNKWTWIQDGATCHTATISMDHLRSVVPDVFPKKDWPANSPDDNVIENTFGFMDAEVQAKGAQTLRSLEANVRSAWKKVTPEYCKKCIDTMPQRLKQIIDSNGEYVYELNNQRPSL